MARWDRDNNPPDDWDEEQDGWHLFTLCVPNSLGWRQVIITAIGQTTSARFYTWAGGQALVAKNIAERMFDTMSFDCNNDLKRLADALESIDEKTETLIDWDEFLEDVSTVLGIGHAFTLFVKFISDHFPSLKAQVNKTEVLRMCMEYFTWRAPMITGVTAANASLAAIAGVMAASKVLAIIDTILGGLDVLGSWYSNIFGDWSLYDNVIKPLLVKLISDDEGGEGGDNPDADPDNRVITVMVNAMVEGGAMTCAPDLTVNCGCAGGAGCSDGGGTGLPLVEPIPEGDPPPAGSEFAEPEEGYYSPAYQGRKCSVANLLVDTLITALTYLRDADFAQTLGLGVGAASLAFTLLLALLSGPLLVGLSVIGAFAAIVTIFLAYTIDLDEIIDALTADRDTYICVLYNSTDSSVIDDFCSELDDDGVALSGQLLVRALLTAKTLQFLFHKYIAGDGLAVEAQIAAHPHTTPCDSCAEENYWNFVLSQYEWLVDEDASTSGEYIPNYGFKGCRGGVGDARLVIYYPTKVSFNDLEFLAYGWGGQITRLRIYESDDLEAWNQIAYDEFVSTPGETWLFYSDLDLVDKYIKIRIERFLSNPCVKISAVRLLEDE